MQGPVVVESSPLKWQSSISQNEERNRVPGGKIPSHLKPEVLVGSKTTIGKVDVVTVSTADMTSLSTKDNFLPSRFNHEMEDEYESGLQTDYTFTTQQLKKEPNNGALRVKIAQTCILISEMYAYYLAQTHAEEEIDREDEELYLSKQNEFLEQAEEECQHAKNINPLDPLAYYTESMIMEFQGVNCQEIEKVEAYLKLLKLAMALDPSKKEIKKTWDEAVDFLKKRWLELKNSEAISRETHVEWTKKLNAIVSSNPLKDLFQANPELFKLAKDVKHAAFFKRNPELKSVEVFLAKYPGAGIIPLDSLSVEAIRSAVAKAENNPLATKLFLAHPKGHKAIKEEELANEIKDAMVKYAEKNKVLKVYLGNKEDSDLIINCFKLDSSLPDKFSTLTSEIREVEGFSIPVYTLSISL